MLAPFFCWPSNIIDLGADQKILSYTLISDAWFLFLFKKEGDFSWQAQTSQEASTHWPTHNKVDLKPVHIWVGWLN